MWRDEQRSEGMTLKTLERKIEVADRCQTRDGAGEDVCESDGYKLWMRLGDRYEVEAVGRSVGR